MSRECATIASKLIDGRALACSLRARMKSDLSATLLQRSAIRPPALSMVVVGNRPDSHSYVRMKKVACGEVGIVSDVLQLPVDTSETALLRVVSELNARSDVDGILVQFPLPLHINPNAVIEAVSPMKDVDGLHPVNFGRLFLKGCEPLFAPCTPLGCMELLKSCDVSLEGKRTVIIGRSNIVGTPMAALLQRANATVSICHSKTSDVLKYTRSADVVISAVGHPGIWTRDYFKQGSIVIDVGSNLIPDPTDPSVNKVVGDVAFQDVLDVVSRITPVPGGVGPMTITMLLRNTIRSWKLRLSL